MHENQAFTQEQLHELLDRMAESWPSEFIARRNVNKFSGGMIDGKSVANLEAKGEGPVKTKCGRISGYPKWMFVEWLKTRFSVPEQRTSRI